MSLIENIFTPLSAARSKSVEATEADNKSVLKQETYEIKETAPDAFISSKKAEEAKKLRSELEEIKSHQGVIGKAWDGIKNLLHLGASSNKVEEAIDGYEKGELSNKEAEEKIEKYKDGQKMCVDVVGDMLSGIVAVGAAMAAPVSAGGSLLLATGIGAALKICVKSGDAAIGKREYTKKDLTYDVITGSINGLMAPITNALGGAAGSGVAKVCGLNVEKAATRKGAELAGKGFLARLLAKQGSEYAVKEGVKATAKTTMAKVAAYGVDMAVDGAISGASDGFARSVADNDKENLGKNMRDGFIGGLIAAPIIGGGFRLSGKAAKALTKQITKSVGDTTADTVSEEIGGKLGRKGADGLSRSKAAVETGESVADGLSGSKAAVETGESVADGLSDITSDKTGTKAGSEASDKLGKKAGGEIGDGTGKQVAEEVAESTSEETAEKTAKLKSDYIDASDGTADEAGKQVTSKPTDGVSDESGKKAGKLDSDYIDTPDETGDEAGKAKAKKGTADAETDAPEGKAQSEASKTADPAFQKGIEDKIKKLRKSYTTEIREFNVNGKKTQFEFFVGSQSGSNKGGYVINKETGELFYAKIGQVGSQQSKVEILASRIYNLGGVDAPELTAITTPDGAHGLLSKFIPNLEVVSTPDRVLHEGFAMDAFLGNWDAVCSDNALTDGTRAVRIDVGGSMDFRAQGGKKQFTSIVDEMTSFVDGKNHTSQQLFSKMTREDLIVSLKKVVNINEDDLIKILQEEGMEQYQEVLLKRKAFLADFLSEVEKTSDTGLSLKQYMIKVKNQTYGLTIERATSLKDIQDIQASIMKVQDIDVKKALQKQLDDKKLALSQSAVQIKGRPVTKVEIEQMLTDKGFSKTSSGRYAIQLTEDYKQKIIDQYGASTASSIIKKLEKGVGASELDTLTKFINVCDGKYTAMLTKDIKEAVVYYRVLRSGNDTLFKHFDQLTEANWEAVMNTFKYRVQPDAVGALSTYKGSSYDINEALTRMKKNSAYVPKTSIQEQIDAITACIDTQALSQPMTVYRGEGYEVLGSVQVDGTTLDKLMKKAAQSGDPSEISKLIDKVEAHNYVATQERFMSTSLVKDGAFKYNIIWELTMPAGSKGVFLEGANVTGSLNHEVEYLVQRGSKIKITEMHYDTISGKWRLKGTLVN